MIHDHVRRLKVAEAIGIELPPYSLGPARNGQAARQHAFCPHSPIDAVHHGLDDEVETTLKVRRGRAGKFVRPDHFGDAEAVMFTGGQQGPHRPERKRALPLVSGRWLADAVLGHNEATADRAPALYKYFSTITIVGGEAKRVGMYGCLAGTVETQITFRIE